MWFKLSLFFFLNFWSLRYQKKMFTKIEVINSFRGTLAELVLMSMMEILKIIKIYILGYTWYIWKKKKYITHLASFPNLFFWFTSNSKFDALINNTNFRELFFKIVRNFLKSFFKYSQTLLTAYLRYLWHTPVRTSTSRFNLGTYLHKWSL